MARSAMNMHTRTGMPSNTVKRWRSSATCEKIAAGPNSARLNTRTQTAAHGVPTYSTEVPAARLRCPANARPLQATPPQTPFTPPMRTVTPKW